MNFAVILIGGMSKRFGISIPKQFAQINNLELFEYSLRVFLANKQIKEVLLVVHNEYIVHVNEIIKRYESNKSIGVIPGGISRQQSVFNALKHINSVHRVTEKDIILIHDGARPLVVDADINTVIGAIKDGADGSSLAFNSHDTLIEVSEDHTVEFLPRDNIFRIQTPQCFKLSKILKAHQLAETMGIFSSTDDLQVLKLVSENIFLKRGREENFKITTATDLEVFKIIIEGKKYG